jgi:hypothetical protein
MVQCYSVVSKLLYQLSAIHVRNYSFPGYFFMNGNEVANVREEQILVYYLIFFCHLIIQCLKEYCD